MYNKKEIESVKNYCYLGVLCSELAVFVKAINNAVSKANIALGNVISLINKLKLDKWKSINRLFESLTSSVVFYNLKHGESDT